MHRFRNEIAGSLEAIFLICGIVYTTALTSCAKSKISSMRILPVALEHWNSRGGCVGSTSASHLPLAYSALPPRASQKAARSDPSPIFSGSPVVMTEVAILSANCRSSPLQPYSTHAATHLINLLTPRIVSTILTDS